MLGFIFGAISVGLLGVVVGNLNEEHEEVTSYIKRVNEEIARNNEELKRYL